MLRNLAKLLPVVALSAALEAPAQEPKYQADTIARIVEAAEVSYDDLVRLLNSENAAIRAESQRRLERKAVAAVEKSKAPFAHKEALDPTTSLSLEQRRRKEAALAVIEQTEVNLLLKYGTVFRAPAAWNKPGHTVSLTEALRTLSDATGLRMNPQYLPEQTGAEKVPVNGLDGKLFWEVFCALTTENGNQPDVTSNLQGVANINVKSFNRATRRSAVSGPVHADLTVYDSNAHALNISFSSEPRLELDGFRIIGVNIKRDGKTLPPFREASKRDDTSMRIELPEASREDETVTLEIRCEFTSRGGKTKRVAIPQKEVIIGAGGYNIAIGRNVPIPNNSTWTSVELRRSEGSIPHSIGDRFNYLVLDESGAILTPRSDMRIPRGTDTMMYTKNVSHDAAQLDLYMPEAWVASAEHTFVFPDLKLSTKPRVR